MHSSNLSGTNSGMLSSDISAASQSPRNDQQGSAGAAKPAVVLIGNCQMGVMYQCFRMMAPRYSYEYIRGIDADTDEGLEKISAAQIIFAHATHQKEIDKSKSLNRAIFLPRITFSGFHPDIVQVTFKNRQPVPMPLMGYHSSIAIKAWMMGMGIEDAVRLFNRQVYEHLNFHDFWEPSLKALLEEGRVTAAPMEEFVQRWIDGGCFMHTINHPKLCAIADIARHAAKRAMLRLEIEDIESVLADPLLQGPVWPVYPELATRRRVKGSMMFKLDRQLKAISLDEFVAASYTTYGKYETGEIVCPRVDGPKYNSIVAAINTPVSKAHPYKELPDYHYWSRAISRTQMAQVDPIVHVDFNIEPDTRIGTAGSCFAQHLANRLSNAGLNYFVTEPAPVDMPKSEAAIRQFGLFSARYGNIYTARQMVQTFDRAFNKEDFATKVDWRRADGRFVDPFRPQVEPDGFASVDEMLAERAIHLRAVRELFGNLDVFVFTLGLTESWIGPHGYALPLAPGVVAGESGPDYRFHNFSVTEIFEDILNLAARLRDINSRARLLLTVSPVPLVATYENRHVLVSTTASKAALRSAADMAEREIDNVSYFPSYEIITGNFNKGEYFENDLRSVSQAGIDHVMRVFMSHYVNKRNTPIMSSESASTSDIEIREIIDANMKIVCDEEALDSYREH